MVFGDDDDAIEGKKGSFASDVEENGRKKSRIKESENGAKKEMSAARETRSSGGRRSAKLRVKERAVAVCVAVFGPVTDELDVILVSIPAYTGGSLHNSFSHWLVH